MVREEYIKYFTHMQDEDQKRTLGGMAWYDIGWHIHGAVDEDKVFTRNELSERIKHMKVKDFIAKLNALGFTDDTELSFGFINGDEGEYYECEIRNIDDEDRQVGCDDIAVEFKKPVDYIKSEVQCENISLREELVELINRYM